jgi:WhiB family redox-sensing transcriptional regulator
MIAAPQPWMADAACAHLDLTPAEVDRLFFPQRHQTAEHAKAICAGCSVREACLDYALTTRQTFGIWGGTSETQRRALRRDLKQPRPIRHGTEGGHSAHRRRGIPACDACLAAHSAYQAGWKAGKARA